MTATLADRPPAPARSEDVDQTPLDESVERRAATFTAAAAFLACAAAGWVLSGVFPGWAPRVVAVAACAVGPVAVALSLRAKRGAAVQVAGMGAGLLLAVVAGLVSRPTSESLGSLVQSALRGGGLAQAPVAFDPGWRFLLVLITSWLGVAAAGLAVATRRPRLAAALAAPVVVAATLIQPRQAEVVSAVVGLGLLVASLGVAAAVDLVREGASAGRFELRRAGRGMGLLVGLTAALLAASQIGALLPSPREDVVVPPQRPSPSPPQADRELFRVRSPRPLPWRLGTLDVYDGTAWLTPPYDPGRFENLSPGGAVPFAATAKAATIEVEFTVASLSGRALPSVAGQRRITGDRALQVDPRTQVLRVPPGASTAGRRYTVTAAVPPAGADLAATGPPGPALRPFVSVPPPPPEVADLLESLPAGSDFDRLQAARQAYYAAVVSAGAGDPIDVPPARVAELLSGKEGSPYEIAAGEALLARWVGVPSRLGYGWYGGSDAGAGSVSVRPKNGATWLEVWFEGHGWVPIVGKPPRAKSSLSKGAKDEDPSVRPTDRLTVFTYIPVRLAGLGQLADVLRYWAVRAVPLGLLTALSVYLWPALAKVRRRRVRLSAARDSSARIEAAYAEVRDLLTDLGVARPAQTAIEVLDAVAPDDEHTQLAWLVTRALWGDLQRDLTAADAEAAETLSASVRRRLLRAQPVAARLSALVSRSSLREPWGGALARPERAGSRRVWAVVSASAVVLGAGLAVLVSRDGPHPHAPGAVPISPPPNRIGDIAVEREARAEAAFARAGRSSLVAQGRVYSLRAGDSVEGSLQTVVLSSELAGRADEVVDEVIRSLGGGGFQPTRFGRSRGYQLTLPEQRLLLWFAPDLRSYQLLVARNSFDRAPAVFAAILAQQQGQSVDDAVVPVPDPRRGLT